MNKEISIIIPVYNGRDTIEELCRLISDYLVNYQYEIILVDDSCPQGSWKLIEELSLTNQCIEGIKLSRNFGQHQAITAGLDKSSGDYVVVMDCDLQDNPIYIPEMVKLLKISSADILFTRKISRNHNVFKNFTAYLFNTLFNYLVSDKYVYSDGRIGSYSVLTRKAVNNFIKFKDVHRHYLLLLRWLGFKREYFSIEHDARTSGKSSYTISKLIAHAIDGITSQSDKLLKTSLNFAFLIFLLLIFIIIYIVYAKFSTGLLPGWASSVIIGLSSLVINLFFLGVLGIYVGKIFDQVKNRPLYIVDSSTKEK